MGAEAVRALALILVLAGWTVASATAGAVLTLRTIRIRYPEPHRQLQRAIAAEGVARTAKRARRSR